MTNTTDLLEKIRAKVILVVPDIKKCNTCGTYKYSSDCFLNHGGQEVVRPIRLADVLLAANDAPDISRINRDTLLFVSKRDENFRSGWCHWNLTKDLDDQNEETLTFISSILGVV